MKLDVRPPRHGDIWVLKSGTKMLFMDPRVDLDYRLDERDRLLLVASTYGVGSGNWMYTNVHDKEGNYVPSPGWDDILEAGNDLKLFVCRIGSRGPHEYAVEWGRA